MKTHFMNKYEILTQCWLTSTGQHPVYYLALSTSAQNPNRQIGAVDFVYWSRTVRYSLISIID